MMRKFFPLFFLFLITLQQLAFPAQAFAIDYCCPSGYTNCATGGWGNDRQACLLRGYDGNETKCVRSKYRSLNPIPKIYVTDAYDCDLTPSDNFELECEWTRLNNPSSTYHNQPAFCVGGFESEAQLKAATVNFICKENCGSIGNQLRDNFISGQVAQSHSMTGAKVGTNDLGTYYTCLTGDFHSNIEKSLEACLTRHEVVTVGVGLGAGIAATAISGGLLSVGVGIGAGALTANNLGECNTNIEAVTSFSEKSCSDSLRIELHGENVDANLPGAIIDIEDFQLCKQIPASVTSSDPKYANAQDQCVGCERDNGIWTAIGCIKADAGSIVQAIMTVGLSIAGGVALLMLLAASFILSISQGEPKRTSDAKEMITSAVIGLLFIVFSITILQFIGVDILRIPGFGG